MAKKQKRVTSADVVNTDQPEPAIWPVAPSQSGGSGGSSQPFSGSVSATARIRAARSLQSSPDPFFRLVDRLQKSLGKPTRHRGEYIFCIEEGGRDFDVVLRDRGRDIHIGVEKDGELKYEGNADNPGTGFRVVQDLIGKYVHHELDDARAGRAILKKLL